MTFLKSVLFILFFLSIVGEQILFAQTTPLTAKLSQKYRGYLQPINNNPNQEERVELEFKKSYESNGGSKLVIAPLFRVDAPNAVGGARRGDAFLADAQEVWVATGFSFIDFSAGYEQLSWGAADAANPTDIWNPRDYTDLIASKKLSQPTIQALLHPEGLSNIDLQLLYSPIFRNPRLPVLLSDGTRDFKPSDSRWLSPLPTNVMFGANNFTLNYQVREPTYANIGDYGMRIRIPKVFDWDFSLYGFNGMERTPRFAFEERGSASIPSLPITVTLRPSFHRQTMAGADASGFIGESGVGIRLESAYFWRDNSLATSPALIRNDYIESVISADRSFSKEGFSLLDYINISYIQHDETTRRSRAQSTSYLPPISLTQPWDRTITLLVKKEFIEKWSVKNVFVYETTNDSYYINPSLITDWTENLNTEVGFDLMGGPENSFFGQYRDNQRVVFNATYLF